MREGCWPLKSVSQFQFLTEMLVLLISINSSELLLSKCVQFFSIFWDLMVHQPVWADCLGEAVLMGSTDLLPSPSCPALKTMLHPPPLLILVGFYFVTLFCHLSWISGGIRGKWVYSTTMVIQKFYVGWVRVFYYLQLRASLSDMLPTVFSHRNSLQHDS